MVLNRDSADSRQSIYSLLGSLKKNYTLHYLECLGSAKWSMKFQRFRNLKKVKNHSSICILIEWNYINFEVRWSWQEIESRCNKHSLTHIHTRSHPHIHIHAHTHAHTHSLSHTHTYTSTQTQTHAFIERFHTSVRRSSWTNKRDNLLLCQHNKKTFLNFKTTTFSRKLYQQSKQKHSNEC